MTFEPPRIEHGPPVIRVWRTRYGWEWEAAEPTTGPGGGRMEHPFASGWAITATGAERAARRHARRQARQRAERAARDAADWRTP